MLDQNVMLEFMRETAPHAYNAIYNKALEEAAKKIRGLILDVNNDYDQGWNAGIGNSVNYIRALERKL